MSENARRLALLLSLMLMARFTAGCHQASDPPAPQMTQVAQPSPAGEIAQAPSEVARGNLHFVDGFQAGRDAAAAQGKPMLVFFTAPWCRYCHQMADEAFSQSQVVALADRFVCVLVDADREPEVCQEFRVRAYPTVQFFSHRGIALNRVTGKRPGHEFIMEMQSALQQVARRDALPTGRVQR